MSRALTGPLSFGLSKAISRPEGVGVRYAAFYADWAAENYALDGEVVPVADLMSVANSGGYALDEAGVFHSFGANALRRTDRGLLVEAAATNLLDYSIPNATNGWTLTAVGLTDGQADPAGGTGAVLVTESGSGALLRRTATTTVTASSVYVASRIVKRGNTDWVRFGVARETGLTNQSRAWFNLATGAVGTRNDSGTGCGGSAAGIIPLGGGYYLIYIVFTAPTTAVCSFMMSASADASTNRADIGGGTGVGTTWLNWNSQLELGTVPSSPIITTTAAATRNADVVTLAIPTGVDSLTITYDDDTTTEASVTPGGSYQLPVSAKYYKIAASEGAAPTFP